MSNNPYKEQLINNQKQNNNQFNSQSYNSFNNNQQYQQSYNQWNQQENMNYNQQYQQQNISYNSQQYINTGNQFQQDNNQNFNKSNPMYKKHSKSFKETKLGKLFFGKEERSRIFRTCVSAFISAALACLLIISISNCSSKKGVVLGGAGSDITQNDDSDTLAEAVANKCLPSILSINTYTLKGTNEKLAGKGSGVIISEDGYVLTNQHVVAGASSITVKVNSEEKYADKIGEDSSSDIAVLKIRDINGLTAIQLGDSDKIKIGE